MHVQKKLGRPSWILEKKGKKTLFSAGTQHTGHLEGWLCWWKAMASLHIGRGILISHLVLHYFRYKMAAEVGQYLWGSIWAHRLDGPHVLYIKWTVWAMAWCMSKKKLGRPSWIYSVQCTVYSVECTVWLYSTTVQYNCTVYTVHILYNKNKIIFFFPQLTRIRPASEDNLGRSSSIGNLQWLTNRYTHICTALYVIYYNVM